MATQDDIWEALKTEGSAAIKKLCDLREPESQTLEFKSKAKPDTVDFDKEDRRNLGMALSAFSNAVGGVIIWGIAPVKTGGETTAGIRVGASSGRPHMSLAPDDRRYYVRVGPSTLSMVDFLVRDMLRIKTAPQLALTTKFRAVSRGDDDTQIGFVITVENTGDVTALHPYLMVERKPSQHFQPFLFEASASMRKESLLFTAEPKLILHPGFSADAAYLELSALPGGKVRIRRADGNWSKPHFTWEQGFRIRAWVGCENVPAREYLLEVSGDQLSDAVDPILSGHSEASGGDVTEIHPEK